MEGYGTTTQRLSTPTPPPSASHDHRESNDSAKTLYTFTFSFPFNIPSSPESAAARIIKNLGTFSLYYAIFVWTVLFITLVPKRKVSIVYLVATTEVAFLYVLLLRAFPSSALLHKIIDRRFVLFLLFVICGVEMILTRAGIHFFVTISAQMFR